MNSKAKLAIAGVAGLLVGVAGATALAVFNPMAAERQAVEISPGSDGNIHETFYMDAPDQAIAATHNGDKPIPTFPPGIAKLDEPLIRAGFVLLAKVKNKAGEIVGYTSEQEVVSAESNIMAGRMIMDTTWTVTIPGRGTLFLSQREDGSEFAKRAVMPALLMKREFNRPWTFVTTAGPLPDGRGRIVGGTGEFEGIDGTFVEVTHLRRFTTQGMLFATIELQLSYKLPSRSPAEGT